MSKFEVLLSTNHTQDAGQVGVGNQTPTEQGESSAPMQHIAVVESMVISPTNTLWLIFNFRQFNTSTLKLVYLDLRRKFNTL